MKHITKVVLKNFKKFALYEVDFVDGLNILVGDNEAGKSSLLLAIELALSGSRSKVESIGFQTLFNNGIIEAFLTGEKKLDKLPILEVELYLNEQGKPDLHGNGNSKGIARDGLRMTCQPMDEHSKHIAEVLADVDPNFPFEYYAVKFATFSREAYSGYDRFLRHVAIDSAQIGNEHASRVYTRSIYETQTSPAERSMRENQYRKHKGSFADESLGRLNNTLDDYQFDVRTGAKANLESDLIIKEGGIPLDSRGRGRQCFVKTEFALKGAKSERALDIVLLEEPENHLSHSNMRKLIARMAESKDKQVIVATHSSLVAARLDLRRAILMDLVSPKPATLADLPDTTAAFFMKAPDNNILEFALSERALLVEGDAEFILLEALYGKHSGSSLAKDRVHVISVGGTSFKRYLDLAKSLKIRTAVVRDNDGRYEANCVAPYANYAGLDHVAVFADQDEARWTFEVCFYQDNKAVCDEIFAAKRKKLTVEEYMLDNKAEAALALLDEKGEAVIAPAYLQQAIAWIRK